MRKLLIATIILIILISIGHTQDEVKKEKKIKVFLDCTREWLCDFDYVRTEMKMVDFVRDRLLADVHILVIFQFTSSGGEQSQLHFLGQNQFINQNDTLTYFNDPTKTEDEKRKLMVQYLKLGLARYYARSGIAKDIQINYTSTDSTSETKQQQKKDPWNFWQFSIGASGFFDGNQNIKSQSLSSYISGGKETNMSRTNISLNIDNRKTVFTLPDSSEDEVKSNNIFFDFNHAKKLNEHWAIGSNINLNKSLFENIDLRLLARPRLEYSFTPYKNFNNERVIVQYVIGPEYSNYTDTTIYFKKKEWQFSQSLNLITSFTKPWGSINVGAFWSNYMSDFKKNNLSFTGSVSWKIFKGLQFGVGGSYSFVRNQINIQKGQASVTDVLTRRRALLSSYDYFFAVGFSYRFGSIFNNAIFPAFKGLNFSLNL